MHLLVEMHLNIKIGMFEQVSKPLKMDGIHIFLLDVACLTSMQNVHMAIWLQENVAK
jgi:hypothetical protein